VVTNFEDADKAETEAKAKKASNVGHEGRSSDGFILFNGISILKVESTRQM
jgi:hypothetical protein